MESLSVNQQRKSPSISIKAQAKKSKQKPIKVVYISSPMKFTTSASHFRALVQELTGQYSDLADNTDRYCPTTKTMENTTDPICAEITDESVVIADRSITAEFYSSGTAAQHLDMQFNEVFGAHIMRRADLMPPFYFHNEFQGGGSLHNINSGV